MAVREEIKSLLAKEGYTITRIADEMTKKVGKKYTVKGLSQKLANNTLKYEEFRQIVEILGYSIKLEK